MARAPRRSTTAPGSERALSSSASVSEAIDDTTVVALDGVVIRLGGRSTAERISAIAERQRGRVSRRQLLAAGLDRRVVDRRIANGGLLPTYPGVFAVGYRGRAPLAAETEALLAMRHPASLSHASAAAIWGLPATGDPLVHVTVPGSAGGHPPGVVAHRSVILTPHDIRIRDGLPVTSPERTVLDLAATGTPREIERNVDHALRTTPMTTSQLTRLLRCAGRHHGRAVLEDLLGHHRAATTFTRSEAEERLLALIRRAGLPEPLLNQHRHGYEIDFLWPAHNVAVEVDGFATHGGRAAFERDRRKSADLHAAGITLMRVTWRQISEPEALRTMINLAQLIFAAEG